MEAPGRFCSRTPGTTGKTPRGCPGPARDRRAGCPRHGLPAPIHAPLTPQYPPRAWAGPRGAGNWVGEGVALGSHPRPGVLGGQSRGHGGGLGDQACRCLRQGTPGVPSQPRKAVCHPHRPGEPGTSPPTGKAQAHPSVDGGQTPKPSGCYGHTLSVTRSVSCKRLSAKE